MVTRSHWTRSLHVSIRPLCCCRPHSRSTAPKHAAAGAKATDAPDAAAGARETQPEEASIEESLTGSADLLEQAEEESGSSGGAFNPVTGEINWDCPCLGGMAHGPCGMQFREAFSCFVFSEKDPKGIDCVEKFKAMQDCFREHPDVYGEGSSTQNRRSLSLD